jgi:hypothetical protein
VTSFIAVRIPYDRPVAGHLETSERMAALRAELSTLPATVGPSRREGREGRFVVMVPPSKEDAARALLRRYGPDNAARWAFRLADGSIVVGPVQGCGGVLRWNEGRDRLQLDTERARAGEELSVYEPKPGHVRVYPDYSAAGNGDPVDVDLRTAVLL